MQSATKQNRRMDLLGIHSVDHFSLAVPDLSHAEKFYDAFGLKLIAGGKSLYLHTFDHPHRWGRLVEGPRKALQHVSFGAFEDDMPRFAGHLKQLRIDRLKPPPGEDDRGLWFRSPQGHLFEIRPAEKCSPDEKSVFGLDAESSPTRGTYSRKEAPKVQPRRLSHVLLYTPDVGGSIEFLSAVLGLRLSDRSRDIVGFLHGVHGSDHHLVAVVKSSGPGFHHCSWDVGSPQDVGLGQMQMAANGYSAGWGLGRHVLGSNYFYYVQDPWGSFSEYSAGMDHIPCTMEWQSTDSPPEDSFYLWGPPPPPDFVTNHEMQ
jgi:catechol 2,3-dioxygenase-like lactoylglutathione lyase family enzyme